MTLSEYQELSKRTLKDMGDYYKNMAHMDLGILDELGELASAIKKHFAYGKELDLTNICEELGDLLFYVVGKYKFSKYQIDKHFIELIYENQLRGDSDYEYFIDIIKKMQEFNQLNGRNQIGIIFSIGHHYNIKPQQIMTKNLEKLNIRYKDGFSEKEALNRDLEAERKSLES